MWIELAHAPRYHMTTTGVNLPGAPCPVGRAQNCISMFSTPEQAPTGNTISAFKRNDSKKKWNVSKATKPSLKEPDLGGWIFALPYASFGVELQESEAVSARQQSSERSQDGAKHCFLVAASRHPYGMAERETPISLC